MPTQKRVEAAPDLTGQLDKARRNLAAELVRATDLEDGGGLDVLYAGRLADVLNTLKDV